jgi:hypothetical protein
MLQGQSGWVKAPGEWFAKADYFFFTSARYYSPAGEALTTSRFFQHSLQVYAEYGFRERVTLSLTAPLLRAQQFETTRLVLGQGDLRLDAKYGLLRGSLPVSLSGGIELPTGRAGATAANRSIPGDFIVLPTGDGEANFWLTLAASRSLGKAYASLFAAYGLRTRFEGKAFRDLIQVGGELGWKPTPAWLLMLKARAQVSSGPSLHPELGFVRGDATRFASLSAGAMRRLRGDFGLAAEAGSAIPGLLPPRNLYVAPYYSLGLFWEGRRAAAPRR